MEHRLRLCRLRPRRSSRPVRRELHRFRSENGAAAGIGPLLDKGLWRVRAARIGRRQEHPCPTTTVTARSRTYPTNESSKPPVLMDSVSWFAISTTTGGRTFTSRTIRLHRSFTRTITTARLRISALKPELRIAPTESPGGQGVRGGLRWRRALDLVKTNFAGDTSSLYRNMGNMIFDDQTFRAGLGGTRDSSAGEPVFSTTTMTVGRTSPGVQRTRHRSAIGVGISNT